MLELSLPKLSFGTTYNNCGSYLSSFLLLQEIYLYNKVLHISDTEKSVLHKQKVSDFFQIDISQVSNFADIVNFKYDKKSKFITEKDIFYLDIDNLDKYRKEHTCAINIGSSIGISKLTESFHSLGIVFSDFPKSYCFKVQGDILVYFDHNCDEVKMSFWGDEVESIEYKGITYTDFCFGSPIDLHDIGYSSKVNRSIIDWFCEKEEAVFIFDKVDYYSFFDAFDISNINYLAISELSNTRKTISAGVENIQVQDIYDLKKLLSQEKDIHIISKNKKTIDNFLDLNGFSHISCIHSTVNNLKSFCLQQQYVICDDILSYIFVKKRRKKSVSENMDLLLQIKPGDYIVHIDHGIGIFDSIITKELQNKKVEYIKILYKGNDTLFVPITEIGRVSKYVGLENPKLTNLSNKEWSKKLGKAQEDIEIVAQELLDIYAKRELQTGYIFPSFPDQEAEFFQSFEYTYTEDQYTCIRDIFDDMESEKTMDRLICGDVGFGKTEVAFSAIFKSMVAGKQAVLISPLVVLAYEHFEKAQNRFENFPFNIAVMTRFESNGVIKTTLSKLKEGKIDFIIGTHRLLSEDVEYKNLGLLVIDEEHKFGVKAKEKIKSYKGNIDILSLSATPIPRSLNMALSGLKDVSLLTTPPSGKQSIESLVCPFDEEVIFQACKKEFERGGQVFFIHNRVETILGLQSFLEKLLPGKSVVVAHGQLNGDLLEKHIIAFKQKRYDILLATTVIENGIDFRNVNTIFINDAMNFGISQIHQLRGRVGRGRNKGYCYLLFQKDKIKEDAAKRLKLIVDYSHLGAGFELAVKDLEVRGGGDILGIKQSGSSSQVGVTLFLEMLEDKIETIKSKKNNTIDLVNSYKKKVLNVEIDVDIEAYIDNVFFNSELDKIHFYREIESLYELDELETIKNDLYENVVDVPQSTKNFFDILTLKLVVPKYNISSVKKVGSYYHINFSDAVQIENIQSVLQSDKKLYFTLVNQKRIKVATKHFVSSQKFVQYLLTLFSQGPSKKRKIKLKK